MQISLNNGDFTKSTILLAFSMMIFSCGNSEKGEKEEVKLVNYQKTPVQVKKEDGEKRAKRLGDKQLSKGVGPINFVEIDKEINKEAAEKGAALFNNLCTACHRMDTRLVGPELAGVKERRSPEWIMNMILSPEQMVKEDPTAKKLLVEYGSVMIDQNLSQDDARDVLEYFRQYDEK